MSQWTLTQLARGRTLLQAGKDPQYLTPTARAQYDLAATAAGYAKARARLLPHRSRLAALPLVCGDCCEAARHGDRGCSVHPAGTGACP